MTLTNSTVSGNTASCARTGCSALGGGLITSGGTATLTAIIVAKQLAGADCSNSVPVTSNGFNLDSDNSCGLTGTGDKPGVSNPLLGHLALNPPGPSETHALLPGSPAIDAVTSGCPPPVTDQRGVLRLQGSACDMGAYESGSSVPVPTLSEWAQIVLVGLLLLGGLIAVHRWPAPAQSL